MCFNEEKYMHRPMFFSEYNHFMVVWCLSKLSLNTMVFFDECNWIDFVSNRMSRLGSSNYFHKEKWVFKYTTGIIFQSHDREWSKICWKSQRFWYFQLWFRNFTTEFAILNSLKKKCHWILSSNLSHNESQINQIIFNEFLKSMNVCKTKRGICQWTSRDFHKFRILRG